MNLAVRADARGARDRRRRCSRELLTEARRRGLEPADARGPRRATTAALALYARGRVRGGRPPPGYYGDTGEDARHHVDAPPSSRPRCAAGSRSSPDRAAERARGVPHRAPRRRTRSRRTRDLILAIETSCDETAAAVLRDGRERALERRRLARSTSTRGSAAWSRRSRRASTPRRSSASSRRRSTRRACGLADLTAIAVTNGPGLVGALVVGVALREGARARHGAAAGRRQPPRGAPVRQRPRATRTVAPPLVALVVSGGHTSLCTCPPGGSTTRSDRRSTTRRARRSTRWPRRSGSATRAARSSHDWRPRAIPPRSPSRARCCTRATTTSRSRGSRPPS